MAGENRPPTQPYVVSMGRTTITSGQSFPGPWGISSRECADENSNTQQ